jgi:hypothetical protein
MPDPTPDALALEQIAHLRQLASVYTLKARCPQEDVARTALEALFRVQHELQAWLPYLVGGDQDTGMHDLADAPPPMEAARPPYPAPPLHFTDAEPEDEERGATRVTFPPEPLWAGEEPTAEPDRY